MIESEKEFKSKSQSVVTNPELLKEKMEELDDNPDVLDEIIKPADVVTEKILDCLAEEKACEDTMEIVKQQFRRKKFEIEEYLDAIRTLSNQQFWSMAHRRKVISVVSAHNR